MAMLGYADGWMLRFFPFLQVKLRLLSWQRAKHQNTFRIHAEYHFHYKFHYPGSRDDLNFLKNFQQATSKISFALFI